LLTDLRFGLRLLARSPVFTVVAALLLAIGISANTLIFSVVDALLLRPLPVSHPENLVRLVEVHPNDFITWDLPYNFCQAVASHDADLSEVICQGEADVSFREGTSTERVRVHLVSPNFFSSLGVAPYLGRVLAGEDEHQAAHNAVLSYDFWQRRFHGDSAVLGRSIVLGGSSFNIVGVSPIGFNGLTVDTEPDLRVPAAVDRVLIKPVDGMSPKARPLFGQIYGRLRIGVPLARANSEVDSTLHSSYEEEADKIYPSAKDSPSLKTRLRLESIATGVSTLRAQFSRGLEILMAGVALLLLMASANVAGLLLARSAAREREMALRLALGAGPARIVRQLLTEGLLLASLGGVAGILLTLACLPLLRNALPPLRDRGAVLQPLSIHISLDLRVLLFTSLITFLTAILFSASPALRSAGADVATALRGSRGSTQRLRMRQLMVVAQVAICTLLLMGAGLLVETLQRMLSMNAGFDRDHVVTFTIDPGLRAYTPQQIRALSKTLLEKTRLLPGVHAVSIASRGLMRGTGVKATLGAAGSRITSADFLNSSLNEVTPDYFQSMGMRILAGRDFNWLDKPDKAIVNQTFAIKFFHSPNPIGARFGSAGSDRVAKPSSEVIGVVSDAKYRSLREPIPPTVYSPKVDGFESAFILHIRTQQRPEAMVAPVREILRSLDPELPFVEVRTLREEVDASLWQERLLAWLSTLLGTIAVLLACIGLYGALDYAVKSRTREIGVRIALGAQPARIAALFASEALLLTASGLVLGLCSYAAAAVWLRKILYDLRPWEPIPILFVLLSIALMSAIAAGPPAYRAVRTDPATALRSE
jgi:predicted permease